MGIVLCNTVDIGCYIHCFLLELHFFKFIIFLLLLFYLFQLSICYSLGNVLHFAGTFYFEATFSRCRSLLLNKKILFVSHHHLHPLLVVSFWFRFRAPSDYSFHHCTLVPDHTKGHSHSTTLNLCLRWWIRTHNHPFFLNMESITIGNIRCWINNNPVHFCIRLLN